MAKEKNDAMQEVIEKILQGGEEMIIGLCRRNLEKKSESSKYAIVTWYKKMKVFGWEKFHTPTYISIISLYKTKEDLDAAQSDGIIIQYIEKKYAKSLLGVLGVLPEAKENKSDEEEVDPEDRIREGCRNLCELFVEKIKPELRSNGYPDFVLSPIDTVEQAQETLLQYNDAIAYKYELRFPVRKNETIYLDLVLPAPRK